MSATEQGRLPEDPADQQHTLVRLVTRLVVAQATVAAAIGLFYSRRHIPSILITLLLVAALCGLAIMLRSGTHAAWVIALTFEASFVLFGVSRFFAARYVGGTLLAIILAGVLIHPAVARAYAGAAAPGEDGLGEPGLEERGLGQA